MTANGNGEGSMHLKSLQLKNFRNLADERFAFNPEFNFIFGKNAQGKTNIIEAIYYLAELKSFRTTNRRDLICQGSESSRIMATFEKESLSWEIAIALSPAERKVLLNNKKPVGQKAYYELIPLILFEPRHIYLFRDSPSRRREYLNRALYVQDVSFLNLLRDYETVVTQKNRLLKEEPDPELLSAWNEKLIDVGSRIVARRLAWFQEIQADLAREYQSLSGTRERFHLVYRPTQDLFAGQPRLETLGSAEIWQILANKVKAKQGEEIARREAIVGPHRDDFAGFLDGRALGAYGSQGENRTAVIALKLAQLKMYVKKFKKTPLFLLDDVASELDESRCRYLFSYLRDENTQVFLTATENGIRGADFAGHATSFLVENGRVRLV